MVYGPGARLGPYEIVAPLGAGSMGEVYRAWDAKLRREVALKVLPAEAAENAGRLRRFEAEARAVAALNHPGIVTIYSVEEAEGVRFITMELVVGRTLAALIPPGGLNTGKLLDIALPLIDAVGAAHRRGVIHRDLKPANIMVSDEGRVKVLDFGLAKLRMGASAADSALGTAALTQEGQTVGTVAYMSPEQALGRTVDHRSDLFAVGVILYEMATGRRPFQGGTAAAVFDQLLHETPASPVESNPSLPTDLTRIIGRALEKDPAARYSSAETLLRDLQGVARSDAAGAGVPAPGRRSIVVLPFEDISPGRDNEHFSDGLTEEVIADLSRVQAFRVISRSSAMRLKGRERDVRAIGRDLNVDHVVEGSVRKAGEQLRITAQLVDAREDTTLWSETYRGTIEDVFAIQEKVARAIVDALEAKLSPGEEHAIGRRPTGDVRVWETCLRARQEIWRFSAEGLGRAVQLLENARRVVGPNELLEATLSHAWATYVHLGFSTDPSYLRKADECLTRVFELAPGSPRGHFVRGLLHYVRGQLQDAVPDLKKALAVEANDPDVLLMLGYVYALSGREWAARPLFERLLAIDPLTPLTNSVLGFVDHLEGRREQAIESYRRYLEMDPGSAFAGLCYAYALAADRRFDEADALLDRIAAESPGTPYASVACVWLHGVRGDAPKAVEALTPELKAAAAGTELLSRFLCEGLALAGDKEGALEWLTRSIRFGFSSYPYLARFSPFLDSIRGEERFRRLLEEVRSRWERFEV